MIATVVNIHVYYYPQISLGTTYFVMLIYRGYEQLTPIYDNVSGTSKKKISQYGHQIFNVFSNIANCFWKGVNEDTLETLLPPSEIQQELCIFLMSVI